MLHFVCCMFHVAYFLAMQAVQPMWQLGLRRVHEDTFGVHEDTFGVHEDTFGVHEDTFGVHEDTFCVLKT